MMSNPRPDSGKAAMSSSVGASPVCAPGPEPTLSSERPRVVGRTPRRRGRTAEVFPGQGRRRSPGIRPPANPCQVFCTSIRQPRRPRLATTSYRRPGPPWRTTLVQASVTASSNSASPSSSAPRPRKASPSMWRITGTLSASRGNTRQSFTSTLGSSALDTGVCTCPLVAVRTAHDGHFLCVPRLGRGNRRVE